MFVIPMHSLTTDEVLEPLVHLFHNTGIGAAIKFENAGAIILDKFVRCFGSLVHRFQQRILLKTTDDVLPTLVFELADRPGCTCDHYLELVVHHFDRFGV